MSRQNSDLRVNRHCHIYNYSQNWSDEHHHNHSAIKFILTGHYQFLFYQPLSVHGWTSAFLLAVHRLCGVFEGWLSHFLPRWLRTGWQSVISSLEIKIHRLNDIRLANTIPWSLGVHEFPVKPLAAGLKGNPETQRTLMLETPGHFIQSRVHAGNISLCRPNSGSRLMLW